MMKCRPVWGDTSALRVARFSWAKALEDQPDARRVPGRGKRDHFWNPWEDDQHGCVAAPGGCGFNREGLAFAPFGWT